MTTPLGTFTRWDGGPVLRGTGAGWQAGYVYNPAAVVRDDAVVLLYRAHDEDRVSRLGLATSDDGLHFVQEAEPVLEPVEDYEARGVEDPRLTEVDGTYYLTYTGYDGSSALLCLATSTDLRTWTRHGPLFPDLDTWSTVSWARSVRPAQPHSKAGGILPVRSGGLWHMYVGEGAVYHATSPDLLAWTVGDAPVLEGRPGRWDEHLVEVGPQPVVVGDRVVLLTNGARIRSVEDRLVDYRCGAAVFALEDPSRLVARDEGPWLSPALPEERAGLVPEVVFVEGLVDFRGTWFAYFGQADTTTAVATAPVAQVATP